ncbi:hypothetical protein NH340_JMT04092 [Sarcoptes scabiei]|nr:hypothetical protein NH340_JMT04092 [Sarcoptes scabiei]
MALPQRHYFGEQFQSTFQTNQNDTPLAIVWTLTNHSLMAISETKKRRWSLEMDSICQAFESSPSENNHPHYAIILRRYYYYCFIPKHQIEIKEQFTSTGSSMGMDSKERRG